MKKLFNIAGPCIPGKHYMIPALERNDQLESLIENEQYFVIHAARQTGKTTLLKSLVQHINSQGKYHALYCSLEAVQGIDNPREGIFQIVAQLKKALFFEDVKAKEVLDEIRTDADFTTLIYLSVARFSQALEKPLVLLFDEVDCLGNGTLITFLRQLRDGYINRDKIPFAHSIALVGMRNIRDYKARVRDDGKTLGSASPFNVITESFTIGNFSPEEVASLYRQHTEATGQVFEEGAIQKAYYWTQGQPWLVNAIARECVEKILGNSYHQPVTEALIDQAAENIILRRDTHIDSLLERLKEERVRRVIEPVLLGNELNISILADDTQYCLDLGIITDKDKRLQPSNPIYKEVIIRTLSYDTQYALYSSVEVKWIKDGLIDMDRLLMDFQQFWRENSDIWVEKYQYREAASHLILQAFLQRVINGGGHIDREYATGRRRMDLCVHFNGKKYPIELKLLYNEKTFAEGLEQLSAYMDTVGESTGWLVIFDRSTNKPWEEKIYHDTRTEEGKTIHVFGC